MNIEDLEEALEDLFPSGYRLDTDKKSQIVIFTGLVQDEDGELVEFEDEEDEEDKEDEEEDEEDPDFDPDFEPLEEEDDDEE